ncbi:hypothetical protein QC762_401780 [Podospora pseudocomata]|uniref:Glycosyltransferase Family 2 n=1 Tax=Podospora pseudocomata TaxID=2093779 RepID=A0ABR0GEP6_9PEZI|nr:hypothetical protein QC762_401780 [Podospora pseudocomata]
MTLGTEPHFRQVIQGWLRTEPKSIIITTLEARRTYIEGLVEEIGDSRIMVMAVETASYRRQCYEAISKVTTAFYIVVDDRSLWGVSTLDDILAPFRDPRVGGVTGLQAVKPRNGNTLTQWETFGALNLARRNFPHSALAFFNKGQVLNLSGRLSAYRTCIYKDRGFRDAFLHELWLGRFPITTGDDNALTTWLLHKGWRTAFQNSPGVMIAAGSISELALHKTAAPMAARHPSILSLGHHVCVQNAGERPSRARRSQHCCLFHNRLCDDI